ncbi:MAG: phosphotransferase [Provencibacterium sp.]|jgi:Ser/Thr protein kinase RdoA (MazF antagonist)|nr:phosphotransferase [Provencibacterium sp.]
MQQAILEDLWMSYGLFCLDFSPVAGGWLHEKWRMHTAEGDFLVKSFSRRRYKRERWGDIEAALQRQAVLQKEGIPCPAVLLRNGRALRFLKDGTIYMVMSFLPGKSETPETVSREQMRSLGSACGRMHRLFSQMPVSDAYGYPVQPERVLQGLHAHLRACLQETGELPAGYRQAVLLQQPVLEKLPAGFLERQPMGIAHEDFSGDNLLFVKGELSAILDFDRSCYSFVRHDIGRVLLSLALCGSRLDRVKAQAFREGYCEYLPLSCADMADALRLTWCLEMPWWINRGSFEEPSGKVARFREEIIWLSRHWEELTGLLQGEKGADSAPGCR